MLFFNLVFINQMEWSMIPACPSFACISKKGNIEGTNFENLWLMFGYLCFVVYLFMP